MTKVDEIMELVEKRDIHIREWINWEGNRDEVAKSFLKAKEALRRGIESLAKDTERFNFLCDCENEQALDLLAENLGQREELIVLVDELIKEKHHDN